MGGLKMISEWQISGGTGIFLSGLGVFCMDSVTTCLSSDADKLCVPIGLSALSALLFLLSCFVLVYQRCKVRGENPGEAVTSFYCFLGNLCSAIGAVLSKQLDIQVLMGAFAAAVDVVNFISIVFPVCLCWNSKAERRLRMMKRRRRQHLLAVSVLMVLGGGYLTSRIGPSPADRPLNGRKLLHVPLQDNAEILGYVLGLLSLVIACTSKLPALSGACRREMVTGARVFSGVLCSLAGAFYASAILVYDTRFEFVLRAMPWLLSSMCCATLDLLILVIYWCRRGTRQHPQRFSPDTESLLGDSATPTKDNPTMKRHRKQQVLDLDMLSFNLFMEEKKYQENDGDGSLYGCQSSACKKSMPKGGDGVQGGGIGESAPEDDSARGQM